MIFFYDQSATISPNFLHIEIKYTFCVIQANKANADKNDNLRGV